MSDIDEDITGFPDNEMAIYTPQERADMVKRVDNGHEQDYLGLRRSYADRVSTSQALKNRARANLNGNG